MVTLRIGPEQVADTGLSEAENPDLHNIYTNHTNKQVLLAHCSLHAARRASPSPPPRPLRPPPTPTTPDGHHASQPLLVPAYSRHDHCLSLLTESQAATLTSQMVKAVEHRDLLLFNPEMRPATAANVPSAGSKAPRYHTPPPVVFSIPASLIFI